MFIGRENELRKLEELYQTNEFQMPVIFGRRRVGKSTLIRRFIEGKKAIMFTAIESTSTKNLELFSKSIYQVLLPEVKNLPAFTDFDSAFEFLTDYAKKERLIVVIDEYPYMVASQKSISSMLQSYIDTQWKDSKMFLILCGSSMSFMEKQVLGYQSPLYGRRTAQFRILPFDYLTSGKFVPNYSYEDKALVYGVTGGIPKYLELFVPELSVYENIIRLFFSDSGYLYEEPSNLMKQELREIGIYNAIVEALASGTTRVNQLVTKTHTDSSAISYYLKSLISLGIVQREYPITEENNKKKILYSICDNMYRFWYQFVPNGNEMILMHSGDVYFNEVVLPQIPEFMGAIFEQMCRQYLQEKSLSEDSGFKIMNIGRWWGNNPKLQREEEIDLVGINPMKNEILIGECKYKSKGIHLNTAKTLLERGELMSGYDKIHYVLCSKEHYSESVISYANENNIQMVTLKDLYE